jgi:hypothetical protein
MERRAQAGWLWVIIALFARSGVASSPPQEKYLAYNGTAVQRHSLSFLYEEHHVLRFAGDRLADRVVLYTCADGSPFARKTVSYLDPLAPDFLLEDSSNGLEEGIRSEGAARSVQFRENRGAEEKKGPLPAIAGLVADAGFDEFIHENWQALLHGGSLSPPFLVPSRLKEVDFKVYRLRSDTVAGVPAEVFRLKPAGALSWIVKPIDVSYGAATHDLLRYAGVSDLRDSSGNNFEVLITFRTRDRTESDAQSMSDALRAHLAPCR